MAMKIKLFVSFFEIVLCSLFLKTKGLFDKLFDKIRGVKGTQNS